MLVAAMALHLLLIDFLWLLVLVRLVVSEYLLKMNEQCQLVNGAIFINDSTSMSISMSQFLFAYQRFCASDTHAFRLNSIY